MYSLGWLVSKLELELRNPAHVHPSIARVLFQFLEEVRGLPDTGGYLHHKRLQRSEAEKKTSALNIFIRHFDELLCQIFPPGSNVYTCLDKKGCGLPLAAHFYFKVQTKYKLRGADIDKPDVTIRLDPKEAMDRVAMCVFEVARDKESILDADGKLTKDEYASLCSEVETLRIVSVVLEAIAKLGPSPKPARSVMNQESRAKPRGVVRFCDLCFRRAGKTSVHCSGHRNTGVTEDESRYKRAKRYHDSLPSEILAFFNQVKSLATVIALPVNTSIVYQGYGAEIINLADAVTKQKWDVVKDEWWKLIASCFPSVFESLTAETLASESWPSAVKGVWKDLDNKEETISEPKFVIYILLAAEEWLKLERPRTAVKTSKQPISEEIIRLYKLGSIKQSEIARQLNCTRAWVSRVIKQINEQS